MGRLVVTTRQSRIVVGRVEIGQFASRFEPSFAEELSATDSPILNLNTVQSDAVGASELASVDPGKVFNESLGAVDQQAFDFAKLITENLTITEGERRALEKAGVSDLSRIRDEGVALEPIKVLAEALSVLDDDAAITLLKVLTDGGTASEAHSLALLRYLTDEAAASDDDTLNIGKVFSDFGVATDTIDSLSIAKALSETPTTGDSPVLNIQPVVSDATDASDVFARTVQFFRALEEAPGASEAHAIALAQVQGDSVGVTESIAIVQTLLRELTDVATASEAEVRLLAKTLAVESAEAGEAHEIWFRQFRTDAVGAADVPSIGPEKPFSNSVGVADIIDITRALNRADVVGVGSSGSLFNQGYADPTYFAEDYVGDARTFS